MPWKMPIIKTNQGACYEYKFVTGFEETNVVGNIYFANYAVWQGKCREMFLYEYCPDIIEEIKNGLHLITLDLSIQYIAQLFAFNKVVMRMYMETQSVSRILMRFEYYAEKDGNLQLVCKGHQATAAMRENNGTMISTHFPDSMMDIEGLLAQAA
jgi:enediyne core biosynthesis thioesterase